MVLVCLSMVDVVNVTYDFFFIMVWNVCFSGVLECRRINDRW